MKYIFTHGLGQDSSSWDKVISLMTEPFHALCPDLFALINGAETDYQSIYRAFSEYCNTITEPLNLCGLSLGGVLALHYAIDNPAKVQSVVLIGAQYKMPKNLLKLQNAIFRVMPKSLFKNMGLQKGEVIGLTKSMMDLDFSEKLKDVPCPALILCGDKDGANKKAAKGLAEGIPGAELRFVERAGHELNIDRPQELSAMLSAFWGGLKD